MLPSTFEVGDEIRHRNRNDRTYTVKYIGERVLLAEDGRTYVVVHRMDECMYVLAPKSFFNGGHTRWLAYHYDGSCLVNCGGSYTAEYTALGARCRGEFATHVIKINGQTGELSWVKGGPNG